MKPAKMKTKGAGNTGAEAVLPEIAKGRVVSWSEVSKFHRTRHGIYQKNGALLSLLTDLGKISKCYPDFESADGSTLFYTGAGRRGDQKPDIYNRSMIDAVQSGAVVPLFCKLAVNQWEYMGLWQVVDAAYVDDEKNERMIWQFVLKAASDRLSDSGRR